MFKIIHGIDTTHWYQLVEVPEGTPKEKILDLADYSDDYTLVDEYNGTDLEIVEPQKLDDAKLDDMVESWNCVMKYKHDHGMCKHRGLELMPHVTYTLEVAEEE